MMNPAAAAAQRELALLRAALLGGRGPGASEQEITQNTRERQWLAGIRTARGLENVAHQAMLARLSATLTSFSASGRLLQGSARLVAASAAAALLVRLVLRGTLATR